IGERSAPYARDIVKSMSAEEVPPDVATHALSGLGTKGIQALLEIVVDTQHRMEVRVCAAEQCQNTRVSTASERGIANADLLCSVLAKIVENDGNKEDSEPLVIACVKSIGVVMRRVFAAAQRQHGEEATVAMAKKELSPLVAILSPIVQR